MKIKNASILGSKPALEKLLQMPLPVKCSWRIALLAGKINDQLKTIEKVRIGLIKKYGEVDPKTKDMSVKENSANWEKFTTDYNELLDQEVEMIFDKIELPEKIDDKELQIESAILVMLKDFVVIK